MTTIRTKHNSQNKYVILNTESLWDKNLSLDAVGLWARLMSRPDNWEISVLELKKSCRCGENKIYNLLNELIGAGYVFRSQKRIVGKNGSKFGKFEYFVFESLRDREEFQKSFTLDDFQHAGIPHAGNGGITNTELTNTEATNKKENYIKEKVKKNIYTGPFELKLSTEERKKLEDMFGEELVDCKIQGLENQCENKKKTYSSHYKTLLSWCKDQVRKDKLISACYQKTKTVDLIPSDIEKEKNEKLISEILNKYPNLKEKILVDNNEITIIRSSGKPVKWAIKDKFLREYISMNLKELTEANK